MSVRRGAAAIGAAAALALTAGCGMLGLGGEEPESDEARLVGMLNEGYRIEAELSAAEYRIIQNCLEEQGFTIHDQWSIMSWDAYEQESLTDYYPHEEFLLDPDEAAEYGFGQWANSPDGWEDPASEDYYAAQEAKWEDEGDDWEEPDNSEFEGQEPEDQYNWYVAFYGQEYVTQSYGTLQEYTDMYTGEGEYDESAEGDLEEDFAEDDGSLVVENEEMYVEPKPGGCQMEMIQALYGEPTLVEETYEDDGGGGYSYWSYRPENPSYGGEEFWETIEFDYADAMGDTQYEFLDCISARGYEGWEFTEYNSLPIWEFFAELYYQNADEEERMWMSDGSSTIEVPPLPDDAGSSYEEWKTYESKVAVDFAECGDETSYAKTSEDAYEAANLKAYSALEEDFYAWQDEMNEAIKKAQEILDA